MTLYIDATNFEQITYGLKSLGKIVKKSYKVSPQESHKTLAKLDEFLKLNKAKQNQIKKIVVNKGPGSYTGTRVGVAHSLALGFALNIPIKALAKDRFDKEFK